MNAGELRHRIIIELPTSLPNEPWGPKTGWREFARVWARVETIAGNERIRDKAIQSTADVLIKIRYLDSLTPASRIIHEGNALAIVSVSDPDGRRREQVILAKFHGEAK